MQEHKNKIDTLPKNLFVKADQKWGKKTLRSTKK